MLLHCTIHSPTKYNGCLSPREETEQLQPTTAMSEPTPSSTQQLTAPTQDAPLTSPLEKCRAIDNVINAYLNHVNTTNYSAPELEKEHAAIMGWRNAFCRELHRASRYVQQRLYVFHTLLDAGVESGPEPHRSWFKTLLPQYRDTLCALDVFERKLRYAVADKPYFALPDLGRYDGNMSYCRRNSTVARICWLQERDFAHEPRFPNRGRNRYTSENWSWAPSGQPQVLPVEMHWLIGSTDELQLPLNAEWTAIFQLVGALTNLEWRSLGEFRDTLVDQGLMNRDPMTRAGDFTQPATDEAVRSGCTECLVCGDVFADTSAQGTEPAVRMVCGHYIGERCLQAWVDEFLLDAAHDDVTCPHCRTCLIIGSYPQELQAKIQEYVAYLRSDQTLDEQVDEFLLDAKKEDLKGCYGPEVGIMLEKLDQRWTEASRLLSSIDGLMGISDEEPGEEPDEE